MQSLRSKYIFSSDVTASWVNDGASTKIKSQVSQYTKERVACFCGENAGVLIYDHDRYGLPIKFLLCCGCGTVRVQDQIIETDLEKFYREHYRDLYFNMRIPNDELINGEQRPRGRKIIRILSNLSVELKNKKVLEIGAGAAGILDEFRKLGAHTTALEPDNEYANYIREDGQHKIINDFLNDKTVKKFNGERYDVIILSHVLEHISSPVLFLNLVTKLMDENGVLYIEVPSLHNIGDISNKLLDFFHIGHPWAFNKQSLKWACNEAYLTDIHIDKSIHGVFKKTQHKRSIKLSWYKPILILLICCDILARLNLLGFRRKFLKSIADSLPIKFKSYLKKMLQ